jgi:DNA-binding transcriptional ArsR family regulator
MMTTFEALAEPTRRRILDLLVVQPRLVGELADLLKISQPGVSKHLRVLREVGLVRVRQEAQRTGTNCAWCLWPRWTPGWGRT